MYRWLGSSRSRLIAVAAGLVACDRPETFVCANHAECDARANGRCEPDGVCSYPDGACASHRRYASTAGELASACVELAGATCDPNDPMLSDTERALRDLDGDRWYALPGTELAPFCLRQGLSEPVNGTARCVDVIDEYGTTAFDSIDRRLLVFGAASYAGNEVYAFDLHAGMWTQLSPPTPYDQVAVNAEENADGTPNGRNMFDNLTFAPTHGLAIVHGGDLHPGLGTSTGTWRFDPRTATWTRGAELPEVIYRNAGVPYGASAFDPVSGRLIVRSMEALAAYDIDGDTWTELRNLVAIGSASAPRRAVVLPERRLFLAFGGTLDQSASPDVLAWDLDAGRDVTSDWLPGTGDLSVLATSGLGADHDVAADAIVAWAGGAPAIFDLASKEWTRGSAEGAPPTTAGVHGSFRYIPYLNVFLLLHHSGEPIYAYKHRPGCG